MNTLIDGVDRFIGNVFPTKSERFRELAREGQSPTTLMISCSDSRVVPELITQSEPGELFVIRNAGNIVPPWQRTNGGVTSTIEYAVVALGVTDIVICGHADCGAMKAFSAAPGALDKMPSVKEWLSHAEAANATVEACCGAMEAGERLESLIEENVKIQLTHLRSHPCVASGLAAGKLRLHGWVFDIETGVIRALDGASGTYIPLGADGAYAVADFGRETLRVG
ncbi:carbonic anhydrase [Aurantiacibacter xanthus]|uniref:Carbonic anhydrase n=1 Tax=Aurantiacibacter xanthus TaxID=1784712 RepID=A0A3A1P8F8_9SPHN|nr:carbonic anhydrase [Aurantiacibacter xanthus]RIV88152.1 carbonic anhydrase [Aurantiacibacter xanthus]